MIHNRLLALTIAVSNIKTLLNTGNKVGGGVSLRGCLFQLINPYVLQAPVLSYQSMWNTQEQQKSQYSSVVTTYARLLPDTPMIDWKSTKGIVYRLAPPYTLIVPQAYPEAMNLNMPEYYWAQGLIVASHSLRYVLCGNPSCDSMSLAAAAQQLDAIRRTHNLTMMPSSEYYMATCRVLHSVGVSGPTAVFRMETFC